MNSRESDTGEQQLHRGRHNPAPPSAGTFVATALTSGLQVASDSFRIRPWRQGYRAETRQTTYGPGLPPQSTILTVDEHWRPRLLRVNRPGWHAIRAVFAAEHVSFRAGTRFGRRHESFPLSAESSFPLVSGGLAFPLFACRRLAASGRSRLSLLLIPEGFCDLRQDDGSSDVHIRIHGPGGEDRLHLRLRRDGSIQRYHVRNAGLLVTLQSPGRH